MEKTIRKICPFALLLALVLSLFPATLMAAEDDSSSLPESVTASDGESSASSDSASLSGSSSRPDQSTVGFYVRAIIPDNQIDTRQTYFDLLVEPEQTQRLQVEIVNETSEEITVDVATISASTNRNGIIDYRTPGIRDATLLYPFSDIAAPLEDSYEVPANASVRAMVDIEMPEEEYDGIILGGIVFTQNPLEEAEDSSSEPSTSSETGGTSINNIYNYVIGVQLRETDAEVAPDFALAGVAAEVVNYRPAIVHSIRNFEAALAGNVNITVAVYREGETESFLEDGRENINIAPNSVFPFPVYSDGPLKAGTYTSVIHLVREQEEWTFEEQFTISSDTADAVNDGSIEEVPREGLPIWALVLILAVILLLFVIAVLAFLLYQRRKTDQNTLPKDDTV